MLEPNTKAPLFTLPDQNGDMVSLASFAGKKVVLYFYPRDNTPGCTREAVGFASAYQEYQARDIVVIGVSKDSQASHLRFSTKFELPFILLSESNRTPTPQKSSPGWMNTIKNNICISAVKRSLLKLKLP